jgi:hypothetical protein
LENVVSSHAQHRHEQLFRRDARSAVVFAVERLAELADAIAVDERADLPQRVVFGDKVLELDRVKELRLRLTVSHHLGGLLSSVLRRETL